MTEFVSHGRTTSFLAEVVSNEDDYNVPSYCYPGAETNAWVPGIAVRVTSASGAEWLGRFMQGEESPNGVDLCCIHPDGQRLVVVARGSGYVVAPENPSRWEEVPIRPILGHCFDDSSNTLVLFDYTRAIGVNRNGATWKTRSLSWDGLVDVGIKDGALAGKGWDAALSKWVDFVVRLDDGSSSGGASPPD
ncbi:hypothetical protein [Lysobacter soli]|uniref:hypothetical protein n=1 Tax=Lysobacter soli TaxID=453783 RepID=UPI00240F2200|nr:hypothetical protein [Lysobacter soli]MDG2519388.1 hypothetical protein [Lysobacter soli]